MAKTKDAKTARMENPVVRAILIYHREAEEAKRSRMEINKQNWDCYHHRQDFTHKEKGQSKEFLPKQSNAVEQVTYFMQQGLVDTADWFRTEASPGVDKEKMAIKPDQAQKLLLRQLRRAKYSEYVADMLKAGLLGSLMITKVGGCYVPEKKYRTVEKPEGLKVKKELKRKTKMRWQLDLSLVRPEDYFPDPTGDGLYEQEIVRIDHHKLVALARKYPREFDMGVIQSLTHNEDEIEKIEKGRQTGQDVPIGGSRKRIQFIEHWGTICDPDTGEVIVENGVCRITSDGHVITQPMENPAWDGESPYVVSPIMRVPWSVWHRALMDAASLLNLAQNELFNLNLDGAMAAVFGVKQLREDWLEDPSEVDDGIYPGQTLRVSDKAPANAKVLERVDTGTIPESTLAGYQLLDREFQQSTMSNDYRVGSLPQRQVKSTEVVASNQSISTVFTGIVKVIEEACIAETLRKAWNQIAQNANDLDADEVKDLLGAAEALRINNLAPEDRFAGTVSGYKYHVSGLSTTLNKIQDFKKVATLLQTIGTSESLMAEFRQKFSIAKLLSKILKGLDIDEADIKAEPEELQRANDDRKMMMMAIMARAGGGQGGKRSMEEGADTGSQMESPMNGGAENGMGIDRSGMNSGGMTQPS